MAKIVHLANFYGPQSGGLRTMMRQTGARYAAAGHEVHHIVPGAERSDNQLDGVNVHTFKAPVIPKSGGYRLILDTDPIIKLLKTIRPDVIEISDRLTLLRIADWARKHNIPTVMFAHERVDGVINANAPWAPAEKLANRFNRKAHKRVTHVVCTTDFAAKEFHRIGLPIVHIPLGVNLEQFGNERRTTSPETWGRPIQLLLCSRLSPEKRTDFPIELVRRARERGIDVELQIAGEGPLRTHLEELAQGLPVTFHGFVSDRERLSEMLASADFILAPGPIETFGLAALEGLASGTPVICNSSSAIPEVVGEAGRARPLVADEWIDAMLELAAEMPAERRNRARQRAEQFTWERTVSELSALHGISSDGR